MDELIDKMLDKLNRILEEHPDPRLDNTNAPDSKNNG